MTDKIESKKRFNWTEFIAITVLVVTFSGLTLAATWWYMSVQNQQNQENSDQVTSGLMARVNQYAQKIKTLNLNGQTTLVYKGSGYALNYPTTWVYRVYDGNSSGLVAFASSQSDLPAAGSDQQAVIGVTTANAAATAASLSSDPAKVTQKTITLASGLSTTVWTLPAGRGDDLNGKNKIVIYEIKLENGSYLRLQNVNDQSLGIYNQIINSVKLS